MPSAFARTLRSLEHGSNARRLFSLGAIAMPLMAGWFAWATLSRTPVYAATTTARTEIEGSVVPVEVPEAGRVVTSHVALGRKVSAGEVLFELDSTLERARLAELEVHRLGAQKRLEPMRRRKEALLALVESQKRVAGATVRVATKRAATARREAERTQQLAEISNRLAAGGVGSKLSSLEASFAAQRQSDTAVEGAAELSRAAATQMLEVEKLALQDIELARALVDAEIDLMQVEAQIRTFEAQVARRTVRALVAGYLGDVAPVTVGMNVAPGKPVAVIIPDGGLRMVAYFRPTEAVGRVLVGQRALIRWSGFPWTQFGVGEGNVRSVGVEPRSGENNDSIRVEIAIDRTTTTRVPLQHGMPASVEVRVDQATPWQMLMRTVGGSAR